VYVNGKMIPLETIPRMGERGMKENVGRGKFKYDIFDMFSELLYMPQCTATHHNNKKIKYIWFEIKLK
jgi:hypothetical protein